MRMVVPTSLNLAKVDFLTLLIEKKMNIKAIIISVNRVLDTLNDLDHTTAHAYFLLISYLPLLVHLIPYLSGKDPYL